MVISGTLIYPIQWNFAQLNLKLFSDNTSGDEFENSEDMLVDLQKEPQNTKPSILVSFFLLNLLKTLLDNWIYKYSHYNWTWNIFYFIEKDQCDIKRNSQKSTQKINTNSLYRKLFESFLFSHIRF